MGMNLNPYISFENTAREAMEFYQSCLGGDLTVTTFGEAGAEGVQPDLVMHAQLSTSAGFVLMGADTPPFMDYTRPQGISISLSGDDSAALTDYFDKLSRNGEVVTPLAKQMWGDVFGQLVDKFGIGWMVNIVGDAQ